MERTEGFRWVKKEKETVCLVTSGGGNDILCVNALVGDGRPFRMRQQLWIWNSFVPFLRFTKLGNTCSCAVDGNFPPRGWEANKAKEMLSDSLPLPHILPSPPDARRRGTTALFFLPAKGRTFSSSPPTRELLTQLPDMEEFSSAYVPVPEATGREDKTRALGDRWLCPGKAKRLKCDMTPKSQISRTKEVRDPRQPDKL